MGALSNIYKKSGIFQEEFDKIFPARPFTKTNILNYISACTEIVLEKSIEVYPGKGLKFINPLFIVDRVIYPASNLPGDPDILRLLIPVFAIIKSKNMTSLSIPILDNLLQGVCLFFGDIDYQYEYRLFKTFDLNTLSHDEGFIIDEVNEQRFLDKFKYLKVDTGRLSDNFNDFGRFLSATSDEDRQRLIKTLLMYKNISNALSDSLVFSFVNKYNQTHSFFDCMLVLISEQPFNEDDLLDFGLITEGISLPIANYDFSKSKGISAQTMPTRNSLKTLMLSSFRQI